MDSLEEFIEEHLKAFTVDGRYEMDAKFMELFVQYIISSAYNEGRIQGRNDAEDLFKESLNLILNKI